MLRPAPFVLYNPFWPLSPGGRCFLQWWSKRGVVELVAKPLAAGGCANRVMVQQALGHVVIVV